jgi:hypothetical protein
MIDTQTVTGAQVLVDPHVHVGKLPAAASHRPTLSL